MNQSYIKFFTIFILYLLIGIISFAQNYTIKGFVIDSISEEKVPYATLYVNTLKRGVMTNGDGEFELSIPTKKVNVNISSLGYTKKDITLEVADSNIVIKLYPSGVVLNEVVVKKQKHKYSKKNNPAVRFVNKIRENQELTNPKRNEHYNYDKYEKITLGLNNFDDKSQKNWMFDKFAFLSDYVDTSEVSGKPILNVSVKEKASQIYYRKSTNAEKEYITGIKREGIDEMTNQDGVQAFLEDLLREIDLYKNDINILQTRFVSPLSRIAPDFYKFYLTDTVYVNDEKCIQLSFAPHNPSTFGFVGHIYVPEGDSTMFIKRVSMKISPSINLNFVDHMFIAQEFNKAEDGSRLKVKDDLTLELSILPGVQGLYVRKNTTYNNHNFQPIENSNIFEDVRNSITAENAESQDSTFWEIARTNPITKNEDKVGSMLTQLRNVPFYYWSEKVLRVLLSGYLHTSPKSKFDIGPISTFLSKNDTEGVRLKLGGITTANLHKRIFARGYVAYGTSDKKLKYKGELEYSFVDKEYHSREFPVRSFRLTHLYDINQLGQDYSISGHDNIILSIRRLKDNLTTYQRYTNLEFIHEFYNNFSFSTGVMKHSQNATPFVPFINGFGHSIPKYEQVSTKLCLRYAPGEKFYQTKSQRISINHDAPVFELSHTFAPKDFVGNIFEVNKTELRIKNRFWLSAFGFIDIILKGGHVWSTSSYPDLLLPTANISYTIQPESFALMNPLEFINDSYASWDMTYWANGAILNYIPLLKKLKLREAFSFKGIYGRLSDRNNPTKNASLFQFPTLAQPTEMIDPYMEAGVGVDNLFKFLRVDYVWRLTYRNNPNIDKSGLRIALHISF